MRSAPVVKLTVAIVLKALRSRSLLGRAGSGNEWTGALQRNAVTMRMAFERFQPAMSTLVQPDEDTAMLRNRGQVDAAIAIDVDGCDENKATGEPEDLRCGAGHPHHDVRLRRARQHDGIGNAVAVEVCIEGGVRWWCEQPDGRRNMGKHDAESPGECLRN